MIRLAPLLLSLLLSGCLQPTVEVLTRTVTPADSGVARCTSNDECPSGQQCLAGLGSCQPMVVVNRAPAPACGVGEWCWVHPSPQGNPLRAVFVVDAHVAWAFGEGGAIVRGIDGAWASVSSPTDVELNHAWGSGANDVWAWGGPLVRWNGARWSTVDLGTPVSVTSVDGSGPDDVWVVLVSLSGEHTVRRWNGATWRPGPALPAGQFVKSLCVRSASEVWATASTSVTGLPTSLLRWDGGAWSTMHRAATSGERFTSEVVCPADGVALASLYDVDTQVTDVLEVTSGQARRSQLPSPESSLGRTPHGHAVMRGIVTRLWTSTGWVVLPMRDYVRSSAFDFTADLSAGWLAMTTTSTLRWTGTTWDESTLTPRPSLSVFWGADGEDPRAVFGDGLGLALTTSSPTAIELPRSVSGRAMQVNAAWGPRADEAWLVGQGGSIARWHDGIVSVEPSPTSRDLLDIHGSSATNVWAVGSDRALLRNTGTGWTLAPGELPASLARIGDFTFNRVSVLSDDDVMVLGHYPGGGAFPVVLLSWNGRAWSHGQMFGGMHPQLARTSDGTVYLLTDGDGRLSRRRVGETAFTELEVDPQVHPLRLSAGASSGVAFLGLNAGDQAVAYRLVGDRFVQEGPWLPIARFSGFTTGAAGRWWVAGTNSAVMTYHP